MPANRDRVLVSALRAACAQRAITVDAFSGDWILRLTRAGQTEHVVGYSFPLNSATAKEVADDKAAGAELLASRGVPCVEHRLFLRPDLAGYVGARGNWAAIQAFAQASGGDMVVKPNQGTGGLGVTRVQTARELEAAVHAGFEAHRSLALSPFLPIRAEYRAVVLGGEVLLTYEKQRGDDWRHNLAHGAQPVPIPDDTTREAVSALALRAADTLGLVFASIDVVAPEASGAETLLVMEANAGVMLERYARERPDGEATALRIYGAALDRLFPPEASGEVA